MPRVFISVAEDSADMHGAALVRAARDRLPDVNFYGLTGPRMRAAGVDTIFDFTRHAAMLSGVIKVAFRALAARRAILNAWKRDPPAAAVFLDSPALHMPLARAARRRGIPVLYYIAPQTWASRAGRNRRIARDIDALACILPFERDYFRARGIAAEYVGHPLFATLPDHRPDRTIVDQLRGESDSRPAPKPLIALLPGSRKHVIEAMLPQQLAVLDRLRARGVPIRAAVSAVDIDRADRIRTLLARAGYTVNRTFDGPDPPPASAASPAGPATLDLVVDDNAGLLTAADLVLVASGTATLHAAYYRKPMIVMYDAGPLMSLLYRWGGKRRLLTPHLSLVNILAGARVVPEFMPTRPDPATVARLAQDLLADDQWRELLVSGIDRAVTPLENGDPSGRVCELIAGLIRR